MLLLVARSTPLALPKPRAAALTLAVLALACATPRLCAQPDEKKEKDAPPPVKLGLSLNDPKACQGYTLLSPMNSTKTYLIDMQGKVVRTWEAEGSPACMAYLLENGNLLRPCTKRGQQPFQGGPGAGGKVQEFTWDGTLVWDYTFANDKQQPHHDAIKLPNGNVLMIVQDKKTGQEAIAAGRRPQSVGSTLLPDALAEIKPTGKTTGEVVWEWHLWDHLLQDLDSTKTNYGNVKEHPELVDINYGQDVVGAIAAKKGGLDKLKTIGYVGGNTGKKGPNPDWTHFNAVAYNPDLDQIVVSVHAFSEIWVIDHSTSTSEAAGRSGGKSGKGGDLLYRWGNPRAYRAGTAKDQRLFAQHNAHWIPKGLPGAGHLLVFNNGGRRPDGNYSSVDEIVPPADAKGRYALKAGTSYGPDKAAWSYMAPNKSDFYAMLISGAQRLPNGNTLICSGTNGTVFEVTPDKETVWKYVNPVKDNRRPGGFGPPPQAGQILPTFLQDMLNLSAEQKKQLDKLQKETDKSLAKILTKEQMKELKAMGQGFPPGGPGGFGPPGGIGRPGRGGFGGPGGSSLFRSYRYTATYPGLVGRDLTPGKTIEELQPKDRGPK
jgi:hypothetical protein